MSAEEIKAILETPLALFVLMLFGSLISMLKQYRDAKSNGATIGAAEYAFTVETVIMIGANIIAFVALIMTDTLNFTGALGIGYAMNSLADLSPNGRSAAVINSIPDGDK